jgi:hypothetical protein
MVDRRYEARVENGSFGSRTLAARPQPEDDVREGQGADRFVEWQTSDENTIACGGRDRGGPWRRVR